MNWTATTVLTAAALVVAPSVPAHASASAPDTDASADAGDMSAAEARARGREAFASQHYMEAIEMFGQAYDADPDPTDLYNLGRIHEETGQLGEALRYYEEFVRQPRLSLEERRAAAERIEVLRVAVTPDDAEPDSDDADDAPAPRAFGTAGPSGDRPEPGADGGALIISGGALLGVGAMLAIGAGVGFGIAARRASDRVEDLGAGRNPDRLTLSEAEDLEARGKDFETLQITLAVGGGLIAGVGAGLLAAGLVKRRKARQLTLAPTFGPSVAGARAAWRF